MRNDFSERYIFKSEENKLKFASNVQAFFFPSNNEKLSKKMSLKKRVSLLSAKFAFWIFILFQVFLPSFHYLVRVKTSPLERDFPLCVNFHPSCFHRRQGRPSSPFLSWVSTKFFYQFLIWPIYPMFYHP